MTRWIFYEQQTLVLTFSAEELCEKLSQKTKPIQGTTDNFDEVYFRRFRERNAGINFYFRGKVTEEKISIYQALNYPEYFLPRIKGTIAETSQGCILFVKYQLFPSSKWFLLLSLFILACIALTFLLVAQNWLNFILVWMIGLGVYTIILSNFHRKVRISQNLLSKTLF